MLKKIIRGTMLVLMLIGLTSLIPGLQRVKAVTIVVPDDYQTIQEAVNAASLGDTISVRNGTYNEKVTVEKLLTFVGENKENTVIEQLNVSCIGDVYLANLGIDQINIRESANVLATGCRFQEAYIRSNAKLLLSQSEVWETHIYDKGEILGFYDLPFFGRVVFAFPFGFVFYIILLLLAIAVVAGLLVVLFIRMKRKRVSTQGFAEKNLSKSL